MLEAQNDSLNPYIEGDSLPHADEALTVSVAIGKVIESQAATVLQALIAYAVVTTPALTSRQSSEASPALDAEFDNFAAVLDVEDASLVKPRERLYLLLAEYLAMRGLSHEKLHWGLALVRQLGQTGISTGTALFNCVANAYGDIGDHERAVGLYEMILKATPDETVTAHVMANLAVALWKLDRIDEALTYAHRALAVERQHRAQRSVAMSLMNLANMHYARWEMPESLALGREALDIAQQIGDVLLEAQFAGQIAMQMVANLMFDEALAAYEHALKLQTQMGDAVNMAHTRYNYALLLWILRHEAEGREALAMQLAQQAFEVLDRFQLPEARGIARKLAEWQAESDGG